MWAQMVTSASGQVLPPATSAAFVRISDSGQSRGAVSVGQAENSAEKLCLVFWNKHEIPTIVMAGLRAENGIDKTPGHPSHNGAGIGVRFDFSAHTDIRTRCTMGPRDKPEDTGGCDMNGPEH